MIGRGLFFNQGRRRRNSDTDASAQQPLPVRDERGLTSSYATDHSSEGQAFVPAAALDPILGPNVSAIGRRNIQNDLSLHSDCFDDVSSMNDSMLFGPNTTTDYSSPVKSLLEMQQKDPTPPDSPPRMDVTETDIQTVNTENVFSTVGGIGDGGPRKYAQLDIENAVNRILNVSDEYTTESDKLSPTHTKATFGESEPPSPRQEPKPGFREWIRDAPFWLKMMFAGSLFFLFLAFLLVVVGVYVATKSEERAQFSSSTNGEDAWIPDNFFSGGFDLPDMEGSFPIVPRPTPAPVLATFPEVPVISPPKPGATFPPRLDFEPTMAPTGRPIPLQTTVYITSGILPATPPVTNVLASLPGTFENAFLVHLGDWNDATNIACDEAVFQQTASFYRQSSVPVYFAVGDNGTNEARFDLDSDIYIFSHLCQQSTTTVRIR